MSTDAPPPRLTEREYAAFRGAVVSLFAARVAAACAIVYFWDDLPLLGKIAAFVVAVVVVPNLGSIRRAFVTYESYRRDETAAGR